MQKFEIINPSPFMVFNESLKKITAFKIIGFS